MLSGIGPEEELKKHGIDVRVHLPGVGQNLQDRYEVGVVNRMKKNWQVLEGALFDNSDAQYKEWQGSRSGVYTTNGAVLAVIKKSVTSRPLPDLFCFAVVGKFRGYEPDYSRSILDHRNYLTWAVLKAHTNNTGGTVTLRSADPRERPDINFHYFDEGNDERQEDLESVVDGIEFVRETTAHIQHLIEEEEAPGKDKMSRASPSIRKGQRLGPPRLVYLQDWDEGRPHGGSGHRSTGLRYPRSARRRCLCLSEDPGLLHRQLGLHGRRESGGGDP